MGVACRICKGRTRPLDIFSVVQPPSQRYFAFLSIYYGMMANLDHGTDHLRCVCGACLQLKKCPWSYQHTCLKGTGRPGTLPKARNASGAPWALATRSRAAC